MRVYRVRMVEFGRRTYRRVFASSYAEAVRMVEKYIRAHEEEGWARIAA